MNVGGPRRSVLAPAILVALVALGCDERPPEQAPVWLAFGRTGMGPGEFSYPRAAVFDQQRRLYVVDKAARIQCFTAGGEFLHEWRMPDCAAGKPTGLGVGPDGRIYAADTHYSRVVVFEPDGTRVAEFGSRGEGPGQFIMPTDVAVDADGHVYVSEYGGNDRISKFSTEREFLFSFGGPDSGRAMLQRPQGLLLAGDGSLWVTDAGNHRICRFSPDGELLQEFGKSGTGLGELRFPYGIDVLSDGTLVICEYGNNRLQRFTRAGRSLGTWGTAGRRSGQLAYPWSVVVGPEDDVFVIDSGNNRVQVFDGLSPAAWRSPMRVANSSLRGAPSQQSL